YPYLTILDDQQAQIGNFIQLHQTVTVGRWIVVGATSSGFINVFNYGGIVYGVWVPTTGSGSVVGDGGAPADAGSPDGGPRTFSTFTIQSNASGARAISDDSGGAGGVGIALAESNGLGFVYVTADGSRHM